MTDRKTHITDVRTVSIPVTDQDRALDFYTDTLGLEKRLDVPYGDGSQRWIEVAPAGSSTTLALVPPGPSGRAGIDTGIRFLTDDAEADHADLQSRGVDEGEVQHWEGVPPMFSLRDPDGNTLYVVGRMAA